MARHLFESVRYWLWFALPSSIHVWGELLLMPEADTAYFNAHDS